MSLTELMEVDAFVSGILEYLSQRWQSCAVFQRILCKDITGFQNTKDDQLKRRFIYRYETLSD